MNYHEIFEKSLAGAHDALVDTKATKECFFEKKIGVL